MNTGIWALLNMLPDTFSSSIQCALARTILNVSVKFYVSGTAKLLVDHLVIAAEMEINCPVGYRMARYFGN